MPSPSHTPPSENNGKDDSGGDGRDHLFRSSRSSLRTTTPTGRWGESPSSNGNGSGSDDDDVGGSRILPTNERRRRREEEGGFGN